MPFSIALSTVSAMAYRQVAPRSSTRVGSRSNLLGGHHKGLVRAVHIPGCCLHQLEHFIIALDLDITISSMTALSWPETVCAGSGVSRPKDGWHGATLRRCSHSLRDSLCYRSRRIQNRNRSRLQHRNIDSGKLLISVSGTAKITTWLSRASSMGHTLQPLPRCSHSLRGVLHAVKLVLICFSCQVSGCSVFIFPPAPITATLIFPIKPPHG